MPYDSLSKHASPIYGGICQRFGFKFFCLALSATMLLSSSLIVCAQPSATFFIGTNGLKVSVTAEDDSPGLSYSWTFGDGGSGSGRKASHTYSGPGTYTIRLTVTDSENNSETDSGTLRVTELGPEAENPGRTTTGRQTSSKRGRGSPQPITIRQVPAPKTCETLSRDDIRVTSSTGLIQCQIIDGPAGIGNQEVIDAGPIAAVDVWGARGGPGTRSRASSKAAIWSCLDAGTAPRSVVALTAYLADGWTCAQLDRAGTVVLLPGEAAAVVDSTVEVSQEPARVRIAVPPGIWNDDSPIVELDDCQVSTPIQPQFSRESGWRDDWHDDRPRRPKLRC